MSFATEVINIVKENEISDARVCLKKLLKEIRNFQTESKEYIDENYIEFNDSIHSNQKLLSQANHLIQEVDKLFGDIERDAKEEILTLADDVQQYLKELNDLRTGLRVSKKLMQIDELFLELDKIKITNHIDQMRQVINGLRDLIFDVEDKDILIELDCYQNMKVRYLIENEKVLDNLQKRFDSLVYLQEKTFQNTKCVDVKISNDKNEIEITLLMLFETNFNANRIYQFLQSNVFAPIITRPVSFEVNKSSIGSKDKRNTDEFTSFTLSFSTKPLIQNDVINLRPNYKDVFTNITKVFQCLRNLNITLPNGKTFFIQMIERIGDDFYQLLINECLTFAIPSTIDELKASNLADEVRQLHEFLKKIEFINDINDKKLIEFADKIELIFKKRLCLKILKNATDVMRKDLHEMQVVEETKGIQFPRCMVSRNTFELIDLMEQVMHEAAEITSKTVDEYVLADLQERLKSTIPMILERYAPEILTAHGKFLQTIPQQTALFHNNCTYLAWWYTKYNSDKKDEVTKIHGCEAIVAVLQEQGSKHLAFQITNQRKQLTDIMKEFDLNDSMVELGPQPTKIVRQCLRQLDLLKNVWQTILPEMVYNKTMGTIINDFCDEIVRKIIAREDISSAVANGLVSILEIIIERVPPIFSDPDEICVYVKHWIKMKQLQMMLSASMAQIVDQWASGKGPLSLNYRAEDIRHLIRALFQNTDRRAHALNTIV